MTTFTFRWHTIAHVQSRRMQFALATSGPPKTVLQDKIITVKCWNTHGIRKSCRLPGRSQRKFWVPFHASSAAISSLEDWESDPIQDNESEEINHPATSDVADNVPLGAFQRFWKAYSKMLNERPVFVKSLTSLVGFAMGDTLAQVISGNSYNLFRTLRMTLFGILMDGPVGHLWYTTLDKNVFPEAPKSNKAVVSKMLLDQLAWAPVFSCVFFGFMCCLEGRPQYTIISIQKKLIPVLLANYAVWPIAHLINFKFIPSSQRILYINACQVLWSSYLSACQAQGG